MKYNTLPDWVMITGWVAVAILPSAVLGQSAHWKMLSGSRQYEDKNYRKAAQSYAEAGKYPGAVYNTGNAFYLQADYENAAERFTVAAGTTSNKPAQADAWFNAGNAYLRNGDYGEAINAFERSLRLVPNRRDAKINLQMAKKKQPPPPPQPLPPPPPPPPPPRDAWLDQANGRKEPLPGPLTPSAARQLLESAILPGEDDYARQYRKLAPANQPSRGEKAW